MNSVLYVGRLSQGKHASYKQKLFKNSQLQYNQSQQSPPLTRCMTEMLHSIQPGHLQPDPRRHFISHFTLNPLLS
jgi:hypothetical protein